MESLKEVTRGKNLYDKVPAAIKICKLPWSKLAYVMSGGSSKLTGKNIGLLKRIQDEIKRGKPYPEWNVIFDHCIIYQKSLVSLY